MTAAKVLIVTILILMYLAACTFLFADSLPLLWALFFIALHVLYSWSIVWLYAKLKVRNETCWAGLLVPVLTTTSTLGVVIWIIFRPEEKIRDRSDRN